MDKRIHRKNEKKSLTSNIRRGTIAQLSHHHSMSIHWLTKSTLTAAVPQSMRRLVGGAFAYGSLHGGDCASEDPNPHLSRKVHLGP